MQRPRTITGEVNYVDTTGLCGWQFTHPQIHTVQDYYAFSMLKPGKTISAGEYRFGFNGKENDNEFKGDGNHQNYGMRLYDTRLGRFLSVDPLFKKYVWNSTYAFTENNPIKYIDLAN